MSRDKSPDEPTITDLLRRQIEGPTRFCSRSVRVRARAHDGTTTQICFEYASDKTQVKLMRVDRQMIASQKVGYGSWSDDRWSAVMSRYAEKVAALVDDLLNRGYTIEGVESNAPGQELVVAPPSRLARPSTFESYRYIDCSFSCELYRFGLAYRLSNAESLIRDVRLEEHPRRIFAFLSLKREELFALEDLGALLLSLRRAAGTDLQCNYQKSERVDRTPISYTYLNYVPSEARLSRLLSVASEESSAHDYLRLSALVPMVSVGRHDPEHIAALLRYFTDRYLPAASLHNEVLIEAEGLTKTKHGCPIVGNVSVVPIPGGGLAALAFPRSFAKSRAKSSLQAALPVGTSAITENQLGAASDIVQRISQLLHLQRLLLGLYLRLSYAKGLPGVLKLDSVEDLVDPGIAQGLDLLDAHRSAEPGPLHLSTLDRRGG